jgi:MFS family permease
MKSRISTQKKAVQLENNMPVTITSNIKKATRFVVLIGLVSLFADMTYEAARSINGPYLDILGTSATTVGWVAGLGELLGYGLRIISGYISDKTKKYWVITIIGYAVNLISVPLLAWAGYWQMAVLLMILERVGKAIRTPARDAMLSYGTKQMGRGWGFGLHEALDQTGATVGPLLVSAVLFYKHESYHAAFLVLFIPAIIAISILLFAKSLYPHPEQLEIKSTSLDTKGYSRLFWLYLAAAACIAAGYADFPLITYHFKKIDRLKDEFIPLCYALAMVSDGIFALLMGKLYDRIGTKVLIATTLISLCFAPMVFWGNTAWIIAGMITWGIGMGAQESILKATVADLVPTQKRGTGYGLFNTGFGIFWFAGSALMGYLYDVSLTGLILFSMTIQLLAALLFFIFLQKRKRKQIFQTL